MDKIIRIWKDHGTKILGYAQAAMGTFGTIIAALVAIPDLLKPETMKYALAVMAVLGALTAKRGYTNSKGVQGG